VRSFAAQARPMALFHIIQSMTRPNPIPLLLLLAACGGGDREREIADCLAIQRTTYVTGEVRDCLVQRYGWETDEAAEVERERLGAAHPDSATHSDSGRIGDSAGP
jgi:hypothetical protein